MTKQRLLIDVEGVVQGVGFRPFVFGLAVRCAVSGHVANRAGDVIIEAEADEDALERFVVELRERAPAAARVDRIATAAIAPTGQSGFSIAGSDPGDAPAAIAPDVATCDACVTEITDPASRRFGYPFTSCAACGPRLTIVTAAPYDRARTTMAGFPLCAECRAEHDDPSDRRFHAQPIACPACGPKLDVAIDEVARLLREGGIVAIKGLGGYHLACDATSERAVDELRRRKERDAKPFAVMVADTERAAELVELDEVSRALLGSPARPIVLAPRRADAALASGVAPGVADIGLMLPYTPLHHLLMRALPGMPLVMTSGNVSDEPIAFRDDDARARLGGIADRIVSHDRPIHMRCEDSVTRVVGGAPILLRRARGYAPAPIRLPFTVKEPTLALGGHLKAAFTLAAGNVAFVSPHMGDLDELSAYEAFVAGVEHFQALHRVTPTRVVCDWHPDYATTRLANTLGLHVIAVQHHAAHFASAIADAGLSRPAVGVIWDGAGFGDDGAIWGGEIFVGDAHFHRRRMHLAYVPQPGGDRAAIESWRMAVAHLVAAGESADRIGPRAAEVAALCKQGQLAPPTSSVGRLFDAVAALADVASQSTFEGQAAMRLEALARGGIGAPYPFELTEKELVVAPMIRAIAKGGERPDVIARRFHATLVEMAAQACERLAKSEGLSDVVLSGGVFQNAILADQLPRRLAQSGLVAHLQRRVPPNDGGLSFGQLAITAHLGGA